MTTLQIETPRWALPFLKPARYKGAYGGRGCVHPDTLIDTPAGQVKICNFKGGAVWSWSAGKKVQAHATPAFACTLEDLYEVVLDDGHSIIVTDEHKFLTSSGWRMLCELSPGHGVVVQRQKSASCPPPTIAGSDRQESLEDALRCSQKREGCPGDCSLCFHQCGQPPLPARESGLSFAPSPVDERQHSRHAWTCKDGPWYADTRTLSQSLHRLSTWTVRALHAGKHCASWGSCIAEKTFEQLSAFFRLLPLSRLISCHFGQVQEWYALPAGCGIQKNLEQTPQKLDDRLARNDLHKTCNVSVVDEDFIISNIRLIRYHSRQIYWDLHVYGTNCYLSNGIVNHNSGKSHAFAEMVIEAHIMDPKRRTVCVREVQKSLAQSVKRLLELKIEALGAGAYFEVQESVIKSKFGDGLIMFQGMQNHTADSIKSLESIDCAWIEEAQSLSQRSLDLLRPTIRKPGSELWFTWNPDQATDPIEQLLRCENPPPDSVVQRVNYTDNPWFPDVLQAEMEYDRKRDRDRFMHVWEGEYASSTEARVFKNWTVEDFEAPADAVHRFGADWGFAIDPTVLIRCHIIGRKLYIDYEAHMVGCEITDTPTLFHTIPESEKWPIVADSARPETISYMRKNGFPKIMPAIKGPKSVEDGIEWLKSFDIIVHPRCKHTIEELRLYSYKTDPMTNQVIPILADKDNHLMDALRYACESARRTGAVRRKIAEPPKRMYMPSSASWMGA